MPGNKPCEGLCLPLFLGSGARSGPADCPRCSFDACSFQSDSIMESTAFDVSAALEPCSALWSPLCVAGAGADGEPVGLAGAGEAGAAGSPDDSTDPERPRVRWGFHA